MKPKRGPMLLSEVKDLRTTVGWRVRSRRPFRSFQGTIWRYETFDLDGERNELIRIIIDPDSGWDGDRAFTRIGDRDETRYLQVVTGKKGEK